MDRTTKPYKNTKLSDIEKNILENSLRKRSSSSRKKMSALLFFQNVIFSPFSLSIA